MMDTLREMSAEERDALAARVYQKMEREYAVGRPTVGMDLGDLFQDALPLPERNVLSSTRYVTIDALRSDFKDLAYREETERSIAATWQPVVPTTEAATFVEASIAGRKEESVEAA